MSEERTIDEIEQRQREHAAAQAQMGAFYRVMCQTPAFQDLERELKKKMSDLKEKWLTADETESQRIKIRAQVYNEVFDIIKSKILQGDSASKTLSQLNAPVHPYER